MKNNKLNLTAKVLLGACTGFLLSGCGDWNQNPLDGKKGSFGDAKPVPTKPDRARPLRSDTVRINLPDFQSIEEGMLAEFAITARVLLDGYTTSVTVENLADFPGATFNAATGMFRWTPPGGYVDSTGETGPFVTKTLTVRAVGTKADAQILFEDAQRPIRVSRQFKVPEILSITKPENYIREGTTMLVPVVVLDRDAAPTDRNTWPKLIFQSVSGAKSLAGITTVSRDESLGSGQFRIYLQVDTRDGEFTDSIDAFRISLVAASYYHKVSRAQDLALDVYTLMATPVSTWDNVVQATEGQTLTHKFLINDPKMEAWLTLDRTFALPTGSSLTCQPTGRGLLNCTFAWTPAVGQAGDYEIQTYIKSRNNDARDTVQPIKTLTFRTQVLPQGS